MASLVSEKTRLLKINYHHTFEIRKSGKSIVRHTLLLNPQNLTQNETARSSVTQTLGGAYVIDFGSGLPTVSISGTTGYKQRYNDDGELRDGFEEFIHFRNQVYRKFVETNDPNYMMFWYNWEDEEYWCIQPTSFRLQRSNTEALLYRYEFAFTCLSKASVTSSSTQASTSTQTDYALNFSALGIAISTSISNVGEVINAFLLQK